MHQERCFVETPMIIEITVVTIHIRTKTAPIAIISPPVRVTRNIKKPINRANISHRNHLFIKSLGIGLLKLSFNSSISRNAPLGHKFQHQSLPLKKDRVKRKAIIPNTK